MAVHYRIQDRHGRGPFQPGLSKLWLSAELGAPEQLAPIQTELPNFLAIVNEAHQSGYHIGCAARGVEGILFWFLPDEIGALRRLGFRLVRCTNCKIIAETSTQVLIASRAPLSKLPRASWALVDAAAQKEAA